MLTRFGAGFLGLALLAPPALAQEAPRSPTPKPVKLAAKVTDVAVGLEHPWGVELLPDGRFLVTERPGRLRIVNRDGRLSAPLTGVPEVYARGQGGLLDVALSPGFEAVKESGGVPAVAPSETSDGRERGPRSHLALARQSAAAGLRCASHVAIATARRNPAARIRLCASANHSSTARTFLRPRTTNCRSPRLRARALTHST